VDLVKLAKLAISPVLGKGLAEFEVAFTIQSLIFSEINRSSRIFIGEHLGSDSDTIWTARPCGTQLGTSPRGRGVKNREFLVPN